ncbi:NAD(P)/FAD-dependent oxidoreductase [Helicobacter sp. MIT 05-5294]|uniref:NAD(P)/FAD-dependent oxidoreductase n=1 Tax=Helicobacter sp. MIT 05-5294 TaxID=1548150 RepID=UPI00051FE2A1|nr:NAD(P)/FAD-dependent oxidoreductase [Helicobacter sp. MIT 05-5294]TLD86786.1 NAD(P)/FAD-dependent oxidoreductase [Helicobacter sp. MIT 05-5294]
MEQETKRILIIGGGYGGLKVALGLQRQYQGNAKITLISKHDYHYQTTLLHKVAIGTLSARKARIYYRKILNPQKVEFIKDKIKKLCPKENKVIGNGGEYSYDYLIIGLGFKPDNFGISGVDQYTYKLSSLNAALKLTKNIENKFKEFVHTKNPKDLQVIVCGTGFTGIEFTAELATQLDELCLICGIDRKIPKITCIGRSKHILPVFNENLVQTAESKLEALGVEILSSATIKEIQEGKVIVEKEGQTQEIYGNTIIWSAGVKGSDIVENSEIPNKKGRIKVNAKLQCEDFPNIYVVGDCAVVASKDAIHAPTAQLSAQMGDYIAELLCAKLENKAFDKIFKFNHRGTVCSIGHTDGVGIVYHKNVKGEMAAFMKNTIENKWLYSIGGMDMVLKKGQFRYRTSN